MLQYALFRNRLTQGDNDYMAIPQSLSNKKIEDIIKQITKPGSILKETECVAVIHDFFGAISENLKDGYGFVSEYIRIQPSITGVFDGVEDQYDDLRHKKQISVSAAAVLKGATDSLQLEKVAGISPRPEIKSVYDLKSQEMDGQLSPGHMLEISGSKLKLDPEQADEGIFLINASDSSETKIEQVHTNLPSKLAGMLPDVLPSGAYSLEVRNRQGGNKSLSTGVFNAVLSVN